MPSAIMSLEKRGVRVGPTFGDRNAFYRAQALGQTAQEFAPDDKAAAEIESLYSYSIIALYEKQTGEKRDAQSQSA